MRHIFDNKWTWRVIKALNFVLRENIVFPTDEPSLDLRAFGVRPAPCLFIPCTDGVPAYDVVGGGSILLFGTTYQASPVCQPTPQHAPRGLSRCVL